MNHSRTPSLVRLLGKIRSMMVESPDRGPSRSWENAASREIQLEFEFPRYPADLGVSDTNDTLSSKVRARFNAQ